MTWTTYNPLPHQHKMITQLLGTVICYTIWDTAARPSAIGWVYLFFEITWLLLAIGLLMKQLAVQV